MIRYFVSTCLCAFFISPSLAQNYPNRPIRVVIPFAPGGVSDLIVRAIADPLSKALGQPIVSDNRGGAGGTLAASQVAQSTPDGYTLMLGNGGNLAVAPSLYKNLSYDPQKAFAPIAQVARSQLVLVVAPSLPVSSLTDLIKLARSKPGQFTYASSGVGAGPHLAGELFKSLAGINLVHVPYKGSAPMVAALMGGEVNLGFDSIATSIPLVRTGRLKAIAVSGASRSSAAAEIPTMGEAGLPGYNYSSYFALVAPMATDINIKERLSGEVLKIVSSEEIRSQFQGLGLEPSPLTAAKLDEELRKERAKWATVIESARISVD